MKIAETKLPNRFKNALTRAFGPDVTLDYVTQHADDYLVKIPRIGRLAVQRIREYASDRNGK
jgi:hypothetical protein